ncbi:hypothetical protein SH601_01875 [Gracilibacillus sp. S3-1-1]|uniref:Uncharacterized protein n=1 Tax=Gracilibacillus pellucidus TaxID=3095368 RepID=A0ACC6M1A1_9BACI|nr:hypothetical protein [Gracilibacillus sp. S3-1-1]MDX8044722.1 hypothetical protein [Gracilibacillus sp. S3-1-1]
MQQSRGIGYAEYSRKLSKRLTVEQEREEEYKKSQKTVQDIERLVHR